MASPEPSASSASAASPVLTVLSQHHQDHHMQTHPASCGPLIALDTRYEESDLRTPLHALPFPHPKWRVDPDTGAAYEDASAILEACEPGLEDVRPSIESSEETRTKRKMSFEEEENEGFRSKKERQE